MKTKARDIVDGWPKSRSTMPCASRDTSADLLAWRIFCIKRSDSMFWNDYAQRAAAEIAMERIYAAGQQIATDDFRRRGFRFSYSGPPLKIWRGLIIMCDHAEARKLSRRSDPMYDVEMWGCDCGCLFSCDPKELMK